MVGGAAKDGGELPAGGRERPIPALVSQERFLLTVEGGQDQLVDPKGAVGAAGRGPAAQQRDQEAGGQAATYGREPQALGGRWLAASMAVRSPS